LSFSTKNAGVPCESFSETLGSVAHMRRRRSSCATRPFLRPEPVSRAVSCSARSLAMRSISWTGTGFENGTFRPPFVRSYPASSRSKWAAIASPTG
jgi:hypothetical protein